MTETLPSFETLAAESQAILAKLEAMTPDERDISEIAWLLREAATIAEQIKSGRTAPDRIDSVAWRAADALLLARRYVERRWPGDKSPGIHERTGLGARLEAPADE